MAVAAIMPPSMPSSKKRCWNLLVKDVRNNGEQDDPTLVCAAHGTVCMPSCRDRTRNMQGHTAPPRGVK